MQERPPVRPWELVLVAAVLAVLAWAGLAWLLQDGAPPFEHSGRSIQDSVILWERLSSGRGPGSAHYPPLAYTVSAVVYSMVGLSRLSALGSQFLFLVPYLVGCWWIGRALGGRGGGVLTLLAAAGNPWMALHLHGYFLEVGTTAMVAAAFAFLLSSDGGRRPGPMAALGVTLGLGMLCKWSFLFFLAPAMLWPLVTAWREGGRSRELAGGALLAVALTLATLRATLGAGAWGFPWKMYTAALDGWLLLVGVALWSVRGRRWNTGAGLAVCLALGFLVSGWWYFLSIQELQVKAAGDFGQGFSEAESLALLVGTLATCVWAAPLWLAAGTVAGLRYRDLRVPTLVALGGILLPVAFYVYSRVPPGPRYVMPATVLVFAVSFAWWGRIWQAPQLLGALLAGLVLVQVGSWMLPGFHPGNPALETLRPELAAAMRVPVVQGPEKRGLPTAATARRMLEELERSHEYRVTAVILPGSRLDPDILLLEAVLQGRIVDLEHYLPGRTSGEPRTSLVLVLGAEGMDPVVEVPWLADHRLLESWEVRGWGRWCLYQHPTRRDLRPPPRATDGP